MFVFLAVWGVTDAVCHGAAMDYAAQVYGDLQITNLSLEGMINFPDLSTKTVAMFGQIRSGGIMLASVITMMLVKFGGSAMAHMAGGLVGGVQTGGRQGGALASPEGKSSALDSQERAKGSLQYHAAPNHNFETSARANANAMHKNVGANAVYENGAVAQQVGTIEGDTTKGSAIGKNIANANAGETNVSAAAKTSAVKQTQDVSSAQTNIAKGGLGGVADRSATETHSNIGTTQAKATTAHESGMSVEQQAHANQYVSGTQQNAKTQAELNEGNVRERAQRSAAMSVGASVAVAGMFKTNEAAQQFGQRLKGLDLNSSEGRMLAAQDLKQSIAADGVNISNAQAQQAMARGTTLNQSGGAGAYISKNSDGADRLINSGEVRTATGVGSAEQSQANAAAQGTSLENYGRLGSQIVRGASFDANDKSSNMYQKLLDFKEQSGLTNLQISSSGYASAIHFDQQGNIVGVEGLTSAGSGSSRRFDTDEQKNLASQQQVNKGRDGKPVVSKTDGQYGATGPFQFNMMTGEITQAEQYTPLTGTTSNIQTQKTATNNRLGDAAVQVAQVAANGQVLSTDRSSGLMETTNWNAQRINMGPVVTGSLGGAVDETASLIGKGAAIVSGQDKETQDVWGDRAGAWSGALFAGAQNGINDASSLLSSAKNVSATGKAGSSTLGKGTSKVPSQENLNDIFNYHDRLKDIGAL